jgi:hypothetical protein
MAPPIQFYGRLAGKLAASVAIICTAAVVDISDLEDTVPMLDTVPRLKLRQHAPVG